MKRPTKKPVRRTKALDKRKPSKTKAKTTISARALFAVLDAIKDERRHWHIKQVAEKHFAVRAGPSTFTNHPFDDTEQAQAFIQAKCLTAGLKTLDITVKGLP